MFLFRWYWNETNLSDKQVQLCHLASLSLIVICASRVIFLYLMTINDQ